ncbi:MAG: tRNA (guanosine(46)-N7)-methyltransferase TrmB [Imperialibacter sp.]|uniref:tRNA (guanosine(46)-N7)-methyltransferase TrmB n=1 Tax=Imperialibacter sp. TaxID=2038411 RepID=UPI0032EEB3C8
MRNKTDRYKQNRESRNVLEEGKPLFEAIKGKWNTAFFDDDLPLIVELGCGRGEYSVGLAERFSDKNFIGVDIKGDRIWKGSQRAQALGLTNVGFLRTQIQKLEEFFEEGEVSAIWITFPDPRPKDRDVKRRLTSPRFLDMYKSMLKKDGWVYFKTDNTPLFQYTLDLLKEKYTTVDMEYTFDLYQSDLWEEHYGIKTKYELIFTEKGETIKYMKFRFA